jgi:hypothetical protein
MAVLSKTSGDPEQEHRGTPIVEGRTEESTLAGGFDDATARRGKRRRGEEGKRGRGNGGWG